MAENDKHNNLMYNKHNYLMKKDKNDNKNNRYIKNLYLIYKNK